MVILSQVLKEHGQGYAERGHPGGRTVLELERQQLVAWSWPEASRGLRAMGWKEAQKEVPGWTAKSRFLE